ncbi:MAG: DNA alkylation repair protein [Chloroflexota bacterium]
MKAETTFSLKDQLFNQEKVEYLAGLFTAVYPQFQADEFIRQTVVAFPDLELKQRIDHISDTLHAYLPNQYPDALDIILKALPPELDPTKTDDDFGDFILSPLSQFVATYGCTAEFVTISLRALKAITKRFSAEGPIRNFINDFPDQTMAFLKKCAKDSNYHVRRLASEGTRPKLPWAQKLVIDYKRPLPILDLLFADKTRYVTRSVANHLNDISKVDPDLVIETLTRWQKTGLQNEKEMAFVTKHSLRTLVKKGNMAAFKLLGFGETPNISITKFESSTPTVKVGDAFLFNLAFTSNKKQNLIVDYMMTFATDGNKAGQKVFKLKQLELEAGQTVALKKKHPMKLMTTRRLYEGEHRITLQINGQSFGELSFDLISE